MHYADFHSQEKETGNFTLLKYDQMREKCSRNTIVMVAGALNVLLSISKKTLVMGLTSFTDWLHAIKKGQCLHNWNSQQKIFAPNMGGKPKDSVCVDLSYAVCV